MLGVSMKAVSFIGYLNKEFISNNTFSVDIL